MKQTAIALSLLILSSTACLAQDKSVCMPTAELEAGLIDWHNETLASQQDENTYVWASGVGGSWTIVQYTEEGVDEVACVLAHGDNWSPNVDKNVLVANADSASNSKL